VAEPQVDLAIAFEGARARAASLHHAVASPAAEEPPLVSRAVQKGAGLFTAVGLYGAAVGGVFALVFALTYGRVGTLGPRALSLLLAAGAFVAIALVPALKYPPTPPAVGLHETVGYRTLAYFVMIAFSLTALAASAAVGLRAARVFDTVTGALAGGAIYVVLMVGVQRIMPVINEVPGDFPAVVLWNFRVAAIGMQALLWAVLGAAFGAMAAKRLRAQAGG
jgi:hypothetical protein